MAYLDELPRSRSKGEQRSVFDYGRWFRDREGRGFIRSQAWGLTREYLLTMVVVRAHLQVLEFTEEVTPLVNAGRWEGITETGT